MSCDRAEKKLEVIGAGGDARWKRVSGHETAEVVLEILTSLTVHTDPFGHWWCRTKETRTSESIA